MRVYTTKYFRRFQRKEGLADAALCEAVARAENGLIDADLGRGLIKQRVPRKGEGRRSGYRTIIAYRLGTRSVFLFGFSKSGADNITVLEERDLADTGGLLLSLTNAGIQRLIAIGELWVVNCDDENQA